MSIYEVVEVETPAGRPQRWRVARGDGHTEARTGPDYLDRTHAEIHREVIEGTPAGYVVDRIQPRRPLGGGSPEWRISGGAGDDPRPLSSSHAEDRAPASGESLPALLIRLAQQHAAGAPQRIADARRAAAAAKQAVAREADRTKRATARAARPLYSADDFGDCVVCGEEYAPGDMVRDAPAGGVVCEDCQRNPYVSV